MNKKGVGEMREIKFRGKRIDNGELVIGNLVMVCNGETLKRYPCIVVSYNHDTFDWHDVNIETVGQFTGLTDKNGKEIFDGDIMKSSIDIVYHVHWDFENGRFLGRTTDKRIIYVAREPKAAIIGNIYENPELLEMEKE